MSQQKQQRHDDKPEASEAAEVAYLAYVGDREKYSAFGELKDEEQQRWRRVAVSMSVTKAPTFGGRPSIDPITGDPLT